MVTGLIVAGGRSRRFGDGDKAVADLAGTPMIGWVASRLGPAVESLVINCRTEQRFAIEEAMEGMDVAVTYAVDPIPDRGPLAGIHTGLRSITSDFAFIAPCDMPFIDPALVKLSLDRIDECDAAIPRVDGRLQPICAVYRTDAMRTACSTCLASGERRVVDALTHLGYTVIEGDEMPGSVSGWSFRNVNTTDELAEAVRHIDDRSISPSPRRFDGRWNG